MESPKKSCVTCKTVDFICFWGDMPEKKWKRPLLFLLSLFGLAGGGYLFRVSEHPSSQDPFTMVLASVLAILLIFGLIVSLVGCDRCVARLFGGV